MLLSFSQKASVITGQCLKELDQIALLGFIEWDRLELPIAIPILVPTLDVEAHDIRERGRAAIVKVGWVLP